MVTDQDFYEARSIEFSNYALFFFACKGYSFEFYGSELSKSELYWMGYNDAEALLANKTKVKARKRIPFVKPAYSYMYI